MRNWLRDEKRMTTMGIPDFIRHGGGQVSNEQQAEIDKGIKDAEALIEFIRSSNFDSSQLKPYEIQFLKNYLGDKVSQAQPHEKPITSVLNRPSGSETCNCDNCVNIQERAVKDKWLCTNCGFQGRPGTMSCACYDHICAGGDRTGAGCPHGFLTCPVCDDGECDIDSWEIIRDVRQEQEDLQQRHREAVTKITKLLELEGFSIIHISRTSLKQLLSILSGTDKLDQNETTISQEDE